MEKTSLTKEEITLQKLEAIKASGEFNLKKLLPKFFEVLSSHYMLDKRIGKKNYGHPEKMFPAQYVEYYGALSPESAEELEMEPYDDHMVEFKCSIDLKWRYGIWFNEEAKDPKDIVLKIFTQHEWMIDKFKPSYSNFKIDIDLDSFLYHALNDEYDIMLYDLAEFIGMTRNKIFSYVVFGNRRYLRNPIHTYFSDWWYYEVERVVKRKFGFYRDSLISSVLCYFGKKNPIVEDGFVSFAEGCFSPEFEITYVAKKDATDDELAKHYYKNQIPNWLRKLTNIEVTFRQRSETGGLSHPYVFDDEEN